jgi:hypothetical protein
MAEQGSQNVDAGVLIKGADGAVYHIPLNKMQAFRLDDSVQAQVEKSKVFEQQILGRVSSPRDVGLSMADEPTATVILDLSLVLGR